MKALPALFSLVLSATFLHAADTPKVREVRGTVLNINGSPAAGREVSLVGLSRGSSTPQQNEPEALKAWEFTTDAQGRFAARLNDMATSNDKAGHPGWGVYVLVAAGGDTDAGAVSSYLVNESPEKSYGWNRQLDSEWQEPVKVPDAGLDVSLQIKTGVTLKGRVFAWPDGTKPLVGIRVYTNNDTYSDSHSGYGGEILERSIETAADGSFEIKHIYPVKFFVGVGGPHGHRARWSDPGYWLKTRTASGAWEDEVRDVLVPPADGKPLSIEIMAAERGSFAYEGRVSSPDGQPIVGAEVTFPVSFHPQDMTFEDFHTFLRTATGADGRYSFATPTPWLRGIWVEAPGYQRGGKDEERERLYLAPGTYDIVLTPELPDKKKP